MTTIGGGRLIGGSGRVPGAPVVGRMGSGAPTFPPGAVAAYLFESGALTVDATGRGNTLTNNNSVSSGAGVQGGGAAFVAASSQYFSIADNGTGACDVALGTSYGPTDIAFTWSLWIQLASKSDYRHFLGKYASGGVEGIEYAVRYEIGGVDRFVAFVGNGTTYATVTLNSLGSPALNTWYLLHYWHDPVADLVGISYNGNTADTVSWSGGTARHSGPLTIGRLFGAYYHDGLGDQFVLRKRVLTAQERTDEYNSGAGLAFS